MHEAENIKIAMEESAPCERRLTIEVSAASVNRELETLYNNLQKRVRLPGFRPGKVPRRILENHYHATIEHEVFQKLAPKALSEALTKEDLQAVGEPQIEHMVLAKDQPLRFVATVQIIADFTVGDYRGWEFERRIPAVTEADIDEALAQVRERHAALETVAGRPVQEGDFVLLDYQGVLDERPVGEMERKNVVIEIGRGAFFPEIERGLIGMHQGAETTIAVQVPEGDHETAVTGRTMHFRVRVVEIKQKILPELDDDFASAYEEADSLAALRERLRDELEATARQRAEAALHNEILARLVAENPIEVPEVLVQEQMRRLYLRQKQQEMGRELREEEHQIDPESLRERFAEPALEAVRGQVILHRLGKDLGITVTPEEVDAEVASLAARMAQNPEALKKAMERNGALHTLEHTLRERKIFEAIMADLHIADKTEKTATAAPEA